MAKAGLPRNNTLKRAVGKQLKRFQVAAKYRPCRPRRAREKLMQKAINKNVIWVTLLALLLAGCAGTSTQYSNALVKPAQPITNVRVLYLDNKQSGRRDNPADILTAIGYNDLPVLLQERVAIVFALNNLQAAYATVAKGKPGSAAALETIKWPPAVSNAPLLVIQVINGSILSNPQYGSSTVYLNLHANLFDSTARERQWTGQFKNTLAISRLGRVGFDAEFTDEMLKTILEQMSKDGVIKLPDNKATIPARKQGTSSTNPAS